MRRRRAAAGGHRAPYRVQGWVATGYHIISPQRTGHVARGIKSTSPSDWSLPMSTEFADLYHAHYGRIVIQVHAYLGDLAEAQDLTQEAFCRALDSWSRIRAYDD